MIKRCNCTSPNEYPFFSEQKCSVDQDPCIRNVENEFLQRSEELIGKRCLPMCPLQCTRSLFRTSMSSSDLVGHWFLKDIRSNGNLLEDFLVKKQQQANRVLTADLAKKSVLRVNVYYESLSYTISTESPKMDIAGLLANIGGTISLFLGVSVLSVFELVECLIEIYFIMRKTHTIKNSIS